MSPAWCSIQPSLQGVDLKGDFSGKRAVFGSFHKFEAVPIHAWKKRLSYGFGPLFAVHSPMDLTFLATGKCRRKF
jgi:hypothetical protein